MLYVVRLNLIVVLDFLFLNHREFGIINFVWSIIVCFNNRTKSFRQISYDATCTKLGMFNLYAPAWGGVYDSDIRLWAPLGHLLFTLYMRTYVLPFFYAILGFSSSHRQQGSLKQYILNTIWSLWIWLCGQDGIICPRNWRRFTQRMRVDEIIGQGSRNIGGVLDDF